MRMRTRRSDVYVIVMRHAIPHWCRLARPNLALKSILNWRAVQTTLRLPVSSPSDYPHVITCHRCCHVSSASSTQSLFDDQTQMPALRYPTTNSARHLWQHQNMSAYKITVNFWNSHPVVHVYHYCVSPYWTRRQCLHACRHWCVVQYRMTQ